MTSQYKNTLYGCGETTVQAKHSIGFERSAEKVTEASEFSYPILATDISS